MIAEKWRNGITIHLRGDRRHIHDEDIGCYVDGFHLSQHGDGGD
jgi:pyridoxine 5'-phosphate synthase PdxJ